MILCRHKQVYSNIWEVPRIGKKFEKEYGTDFSDELNRVIVHGVLHLIGYDDHSEEDVAEMRSKENYYLSLRELVWRCRKFMMS